MEQLERIQSMESILNRAQAALSALRRALEEYQSLSGQIAELEAYYESEAWQQDFRDDEAGKLPAGLKRGVLSEDGVWNLLAERDALLEELREISLSTNNR